jgi:hypothetical protein
MDEIGKLLGGKYRVLRKIGEGGMGIVYEAEHIALGKRVAVKLLHHEFTQKQEILMRFQREAWAACRIGHPNIVDVSDIDRSPDGAPYMVMELLRGESLAANMANEKRISIARTAHILDQVLSALAAAHDAGIVHRDIKPDNIFLSSTGGRRDFVTVLDFGISKFLVGSITNAALTKTGSVLGTPTYMSPEQARGDTDIDHKADLYAVGAIAYQMLSGREPHSASNLHQLLFRIITDLPEPLEKISPNVPDEVARLIHSAMSKDPDRRPPDARAFQFALRVVVGGETLATAPKLLSWSTAKAGIDKKADAPAERPPEKRAEAKRSPAVSAVEGTETPTLWTKTIGGPRRVAKFFGVFAAAVAIIAAVLIWMYRPDEKEDKLAVVVPLPAPVEKHADESGKTTTPAGQVQVGAKPVLGKVETEKDKGKLVAIEMVKIDVIGLPDRAVVKIDGVRHGERPLILQKGKKPVTVSVRAPGYHSKSERIMPDRDRTVKLTLHRRRQEPAISEKPAVKPVPKKKKESKFLKGKGGTKIKTDYGD